MLTPTEPDEHRPTERLAIHDLQAIVQTDTELGQVAQHRRVRISTRTNRPGYRPGVR